MEQFNIAIGSSALVIIDVFDQDRIAVLSRILRLGGAQRISERVFMLRETSWLDVLPLIEQSFPLSHPDCVHCITSGPGGLKGTSLVPNRTEGGVQPTPDSPPQDPRG